MAVTTLQEDPPRAREHPPQRRPPMPGPKALIAAVLVSLAGPAWLYLGGPGDLMHRVPDYPTAHSMASAIGCTSTFQADGITPTPTDGSAPDIGRCSYLGVRVDLAVYPTTGEAAAWLDGMKARSSRAVGTVGTNWAVLVHARDTTMANRAFRTLRTPTP